MKHAFLITAYKNIHHLKSIMEYFDDNCTFYIHIDKKSIVTEKELNSLKASTQNLFVSRKFKTNWGGVNHLNCILLLLKEALLNKENEYIHLISGHDFPIKSPSYFTTFLNENKGRQFMEYFPLPNKIWENGGMDRLQYYNMYDFIDGKGKYQAYINKFINIQKKIGFKRQLKFNGINLYGGSTWWTLSYDCCKYVIDYSEKNSFFLKLFDYTFCAEEIFFQTVIMNSTFRKDVLNNNLRYIDWEYRNGNIPAVLDKSDILKLTESEHLFARRFEYPTSKSLIEKILTDRN